jgi:FkbM family methyltransferase
LDREIESYETAKVGKFTVEFKNRREFRLLKDEIFKKKAYEFSPVCVSPRIIDAGAHIGLTTLFFKSIYPTASIIAIEPNPELFEILEHNILTNHLEGVTHCNCALSSRKGLADFYIDSEPDSWYSTGSLIEENARKSSPVKKIIVKTLTLDDFLDANIDLLKLDVEGSELKILENARKLSNIERIIIETHDIDGSNPRKVTKLLQKQGFEVTYSDDHSSDNPIKLGIINAYNLK